MRDRQRFDEEMRGISLGQSARGPRAADITATIVFLLGHGVLAFVSVLWVGLSVMGLDPCGYVECGDERWAGIGVKIAFVGSGVLILGDLFVSIWRLTGGKRAWFVPLLFGLAQIALAATGFAFASAAGPV